MLYVSAASYTASLSGGCTCSFLPDFRNLYLDAVRPNMKKITGSPIAGEQPNSQESYKQLYFHNFTYTVCRHSRSNSYLDRWLRIT